MRIHKYSAVLLVFTAAPAFAGQINGASVLTGPISALGGFYATPFVNNDNAVGASPNGVSLSYSVNGNAPSLIGWNQTPTGGVTEYRFTLQMFNNTGVAWTGYLLELLDGSGAVITGNPLDFDFPHFDSPISGNGAQWLAVQHAAGSIALSGSPLASGQVMSLTFPMDIPDPGAVRLRLTPATAVPEPAAWTMLALAGAGALAFQSRRRSARMRIARSHMWRISELPG